MPTPAKSKLDIEKAPNPEAAALALAAQQASKAPTTTGPIFDQAKYDQLKAYNSAAAEAYKASTMPKRAPVEASPLGQYSAAAGRLMDTAKESAPKADEAARGWVKAVGDPSAPATPPATSISAPDPMKFKADAPAQATSISAPDPMKFKAEDPAAKAEATAQGAAAVVTAPPSKVGEVLDKLKAEEAKGGPDFWDVIQAAAAGWGGQMPLYVQKELAAKEAETEQAKTESLLARQAEISKAERAEEQRFAIEQLEKQLASQERIAGIRSGVGVGGVPKLDASGFLAGGM